MKKIILTILSLILLINFISAIVSWNVPSNVEINSNFDVSFYGSSLYGLEINIPDGFIIISDSSEGVLSNGIYRTGYASNLKITLRSPLIEKDYVFTGQYTEGFGVKSFSPKTINVYNLSYTPEISCPACPQDSQWSNCENGKQVKTSYACSSSTNYACKISLEERNCEMPNVCEVGEICEYDKLMYQSSDCSLSTIQECEFGCEDKKCRTNPTNLDNKSGIGDYGNDDKFSIGNLLTIIINFIKSILEKILS